MTTEGILKWGVSQQNYDCVEVGKPQPSAHPTWVRVNNHKCIMINDYTNYPIATFSTFTRL